MATHTLANGHQVAAYTLYDGLLRPRQTQSLGPHGGLLLTDTFYDERGLAAKEFGTYYTTDATAGKLFDPDKAAEC